MVWVFSRPFSSLCAHEPYISSDPITKYFHDNLLMVSKKKKLTSYKERKISIKSIVPVVRGTELSLHSRCPSTKSTVATMAKARSTTLNKQKQFCSFSQSKQEYIFQISRASNQHVRYTWEFFFFNQISLTFGFFVPTKICLFISDWNSSLQSAFYSSVSSSMASTMSMHFWTE